MNWHSPEGCSRDRPSKLSNIQNLRRGPGVTMEIVETWGTSESEWHGGDRCAVLNTYIPALDACHVSLGSSLIN
jgi:hypothetical protein